MKQHITLGIQQYMKNRGNSTPEDLALVGRGKIGKAKVGKAK